VKNYAISSFYLTAIVLILLFIIGHFNPIKVGAYTLKDVDILQDIRADEENNDIDSLPRPKVEPIYSARCQPGMFCIEDYSPNKNALTRFLNALDSTNQKHIRIAFYGDSFIEGDIVTEDLREGLQDIYGGKGVGFVPTSTVLAGYRKSVLIYSDELSSHWLVDSIVTRRETGIAGSYYYPLEGASSIYIGSAFRRHIDTFSTVRILYQNKHQSSIISYAINRKEKGSVELPKAPSIGIAEIKGGISRIWLGYPANSSLKLYGTLLDGDTGVCIDNFAMRGNSGFSMLDVPQETLQASDSLLNYRLIVLQYGLNAVHGNNKDFEAYKKRMLKVIQHMKESFPNADILLLSVSDRSTLKSGKYVTMPGIPYMVNAQRELAAEAEIAFWDVYTAMGGENSMGEFVKSRPPKAAKDYTHLSFEGGRDIGNKLLEALLYEKKKHDERKNFY
jgi:lysophospholipase L1-like esterase